MNGDEEITGVRDLPMQVRPFAASIAAKIREQGTAHASLAGRVTKMEPLLDELRVSAEANHRILKFLAWFVPIVMTFIAALMGAHLALHK